MRPAPNTAALPAAPNTSASASPPTASPAAPTRLPTPPAARSDLLPKDLPAYNAFRLKFHEDRTRRLKATARSRRRTKKKDAARLAVLSEHKVLLGKELAPDQRVHRIFFATILNRTSTIYGYLDTGADRSCISRAILAALAKHADCPVVVEPCAVRLVGWFGSQSKPPARSPSP